MQHKDQFGLNIIELVAVPLAPLWSGPAHEADS